MRRISWAKTENIKSYEHDVPYDEGTQTLYVFEDKTTKERESCIRKGTDPEPYPGKMLQTDARTVAVIELTGQAESRVLQCVPELQNRIQIHDAPEEDVLEILKARKRKELMATRDAVIAEGYRYNDFTFSLSADDRLTLSIQFMSVSVLPAPHYAWKDVHGVYRDIGDAAAFQAFAAGMMMYGQSLYAREEMLQAVLEGARTKEEVQNISWDTVPDGPV